MAKSRPVDMSNVEFLLVKNDIKSFERWGPTLVAEFEMALSCGDFKGIPKTLRKNIAYSLQYLQYIQLQIKELNLHSVIYTQLVKSYVIISVGIIEGIFYHLLKTKKHYKQESWEQEGEAHHTNCFTENGVRKKHIVSTYRELSSPKMGEMDLEAMISKVRDKKLLKLSHKAYPFIKSLKSIRNKVHLQICKDDYDTDYNRLSYKEYTLARYVLYRIMTDAVFAPEKQKNVFDYLKPSREDIQNFRY